MFWLWYGTNSALWKKHLIDIKGNLRGLAWHFTQHSFVLFHLHICTPDPARRPPIFTQVTSHSLHLILTDWYFQASGWGRQSQTNIQQRNFLHFSPEIYLSLIFHSVAHLTSSLHARTAGCLLCVVVSLRCALSHCCNGCALSHTRKTMLRHTE